MVFGSTLGVDVFCSSITVVEDLALGFLLRCGVRYISGKLASPPSTITTGSAKLTGAAFRLTLILSFGIFLRENKYKYILIILYIQLKHILSEHPQN